MPILQSHDCLKCGAALAVDTEKQLYVCPYCGKTYKYEYFAEGNLLEFAYEALFRRDFDTAKDAFSFMLAKEPDNFSALRGHLFASYQISSLEQFDILKNKLNSDNKDLQACLQNTEAGGREYFTALQKAGDLAVEYKEKLAKQNAIIAQERHVLDDSARWEKRLKVWEEGIFLYAFLDERNEWLAFVLPGLIVLYTIGALAVNHYFGIKAVIISTAIGVPLSIVLYFLMKALNRRHYQKKVDPYRLKCLELRADYRLLGKEAEDIKNMYWDELLTTTLVDPDPRF